MKTSCLLGSPFPMMLLRRRRLRVHLVKDFPQSSAQRPRLTATLLPWLRRELVRGLCFNKGLRNWGLSADADVHG